MTYSGSFNINKITVLLLQQLKQVKNVVKFVQSSDDVKGERTSAVILFVENRNTIDKSNDRGGVCGRFPGDINAVARRGIVVRDGA